MKIPSRCTVILLTIAVVVVHGFTVTTNVRSTAITGRNNGFHLFNTMGENDEDIGLTSENTVYRELPTNSLDGNRQDSISTNAGDREESEAITKKANDAEDSETSVKDEKTETKDGEGTDNAEASETSVSEEKEGTEDRKDEEGTSDGEESDVTVSNEREETEDGKDEILSDGEDFIATANNDDEAQDEGEILEVNDNQEDSEATETREETDDGEGSKTNMSDEEEDANNGKNPEGTDSGEDVDDGDSPTVSKTDLNERNETADVEVDVDGKEEVKSEEKTKAYNTSPTFSIPSSPAVNGSEFANVAAIIAKEVALDLLAFIRFGAATLLTSSLPENQRQQLLQRMGAQMLPPAQTADDEDGEKDNATNELEEKRASIQEEIALARAEEAQKNERRWKREKEDIIRQMEEAANARVEDELKIQQMRLQQEQDELLKQKEADMEEEKQRFLLLEQEREKEKEALAKESPSRDQTVADPDLLEDKTKEEEEQNKEMEELLEKRKKQKLALESIEEELRVSVANEAEERERLNTLLEKRKAQQSELDVVEENLRSQVAEIEVEKAQFTKLLAELDTLKEKEAKMQEEIQLKRDVSEAEEDNTADSESDEGSSEDSAESEEDPEHPILGPVVADLGHKRIHFMSAGRLGNIPVWNRNRIYRNNRAKAMAAEKIRSMELGFPGVICLHEATSGKLTIVDGQHRVGMMAALKTTINKKVEKGEDLGDLADVDKVFEKILVEVYPEQETTDGPADAFAEKVFLEINKAEPVKLIDMPGVASAADRKIITEAVQTLSENFPAMFSSSQRCRIPNVNVDNLRSAVFGANILKRHKITTSKKLVEWLVEKNAELGEEYENSPEKQKLMSGKQWSKASANNFYLGLESSWLYK